KDHLISKSKNNKKLENNRSKNLYKDRTDEQDKSAYIDRRKFKKILSIFMIFVIIGLGYTGYKINKVKNGAVEVYIGKEFLGLVRDKDEAISIINIIKEDVSEEYEAKASLEEDLKFESVYAKEERISSKQELAKAIQDKVEFIIEGYAINVNDEEVGVLKSEEEAQEIINKIEESYLKKLDKDRKVKESKFLEEVEISKTKVIPKDISEEKELIEYIKTGGEEIKTHKIEAGESLATIAEIYDTSVKDLEKANKDIDTTDLKPGSEVKLILPKSKLTLENIEEIKYNEDIEYNIVKEKDDNMYKNEKKTKVKGSNGKNKIVSNEIKHNGILVEEKILSKKTDKEPIDEVIVEGTKEIPKTVATGEFTMPTRGRISSPYGRRWGRMHRGLDIAAPHGTAIKAADGGTVSFAGEKGSYGNMVEIDHGNGYKTRYAHCSAIHVEVGQKVAKDKHISNVGNTGRSTGPHLHLEVIKNGVYQDPNNYID